MGTGFGWLLFVFSVFVLGPQVQAQEESWKIIHAGTLLKTPGESPMHEASVVVKGGKIQTVREGFVGADQLGLDGAQVEVVDLSQFFVLPGLIDCHTHLTSSEASNSLAGITRWSDAKWALRSLPTLEKVLQSGFTTVRDVGSFNGAIYDLREAVDMGIVAGPRIVATREMLTPTGGHGDQLPFRPEIEAPSPLSVCDGPYDCRKKVREMAKRGSDFIKIKASSGVFSGTGWFRDDLFFEDELREIVRTAHSENLKVAAHALSGESMKAALRAGVDSIEHGAGMDDEAVRLFREGSVVLVPTLASSALLGESDGDPNGDEKARWLAEVPRRAKESARKAFEGGVTFAFGSDSGVLPHGSAALEFPHLLDIGATPMEAIEMATVNAARLLGLEGEIGKLERGMSADLIAVPRSPLNDIRVLGQVGFVMKSGTIYKRP